MAAVAPPQLRLSVMRDEHVMDTRTPSPVQRAMANESNEAQYKPDLGAEVALLSTKLVNAINYQTTLDDSLQQTRHDLQQARQQLARVSAEKQHLDDLLSTGALVRRSETDKLLAKLRAELILERAAKEAAEKAKKQTDGELESLTSALFEEANTMVAAARKDAEAVERRNAQLKSQLEDTELLLASQQEQLQDLKATMERLQNEGPRSREPSTPSTPVIAGHATLDTSQLSPSASSAVDASPEHPLYFSSLIMPVLRNDTAAFGEFLDLLVLARRLGAHSRTSSSNSAHNPSAINSSIFPAITSASPNIPGSFSLSANSSPSSSTFGSNNSIPPLKDSKFYKRVLGEDIEPTLRLDLAPGLSFLSRRTVIGALLQGTLAVEPYPQNKHYYACALCGESRRSELHIRRHRFKTSEDDTVPKPVCDYCVARLRTTADFVGFLRVVRDGHWRCDNEEDHRAAWEESIRLRERMFWARVGGGVVPCLQQLSPKTAPPSPSTNATARSARQSLESIPESRSLQFQATLPDKPEKASDEAQQQQHQHEHQEQSQVDIARAIVNVSSEAVVTAIPNVEPAHDTPVSPSGVAATLTTPTEESKPAQPGEEAPSTPEAHGQAATSNPVTPLTKDNKEDEEEAVHAAVDTTTQQPAAQPSAPRDVPHEESSQPEAPESTDANPQVQSATSPTATSPTQEAATSTPRTSSVLERIRAMEAKAQGPPPASFD